MTEKRPFDFEKSFAELKEITQWFEQGEVDVDEGLKKFERAHELARELKKRLKEAENKVEEIKVKFKDVIEDEPTVTAAEAAAEAGQGEIEDIPF